MKIIPDFLRLTALCIPSLACGLIAHADEGPRNPHMDSPALPEGMTLDEVLDRAAQPPAYPEAIPADPIYAFTLVELFEARMPTDGTPEHLGWEAQGWIGGDFHKFWWKNEGEAIFEGPDRGEAETDLLYSRLIAPFWNLQMGAQYANEWNSGDYEDRWSAALGLQGLAPYKFELDQTLYLSEDGDVTAAFEAEYDIRVTQRVVLQPKTEIGLSLQEIPSRSLGAGLTDIKLDLRLRYEIEREFAPYLGLRYQVLTGETANIAEAGGEDTEQFMVIAGLRMAF